MKINLDFVPDIILYFAYNQISNDHVLLYQWGDSTIYDCCSTYIYSLIKEKNNCMIFMEKGSLKYLIHECQIKR